MSDERLPLHIDPLRLARAGAQLRGRMPMAEMERFAPLLAQVPGEVEVALDFRVDVERRAFMRLQLRTEVILVCQRCLGPVIHFIEVERLLGVVTSEAQAEKLPDIYEPLYVTEEPLFLREVIEDELILSLPIVPRHAEDECAPAVTGAGTDNEAGAARENPFTVLAGLKNQ
ncbi:YceD family protein [Sulfurivermis fontis]|jgi:uncharacterized protein|uniref:YceD family protein n=1 Tax=Sulfurivermis fontis TaxID=1972068 RepID=UPI000FD708B8|nr:YceD family protein [Sulfurivermis fontis]